MLPYLWYKDSHHNDDTVMRNLDIKFKYPPPPDNTLNIIN